jgi:hypothetical protein
MNKERLLILADALEAWKPGDLGVEYFYLASWQQKYGCGTAACAVGLACALPEFQALGLSMEREYLASGWESYMPRLLVGEHGDYRAWDAVVMFFSLKVNGQGEYLFMDGSYDTDDGTTEKEVAARIRHVVENGFPERD